jgi:hypothetical protein
MHSHRRTSLRQLSTFTALVIALALATAPVAFAERKLSGAVTLSSKDRVSVVLDRETADDGSYVVLKIVTPQEVKIEAFMLPSPPRIVLDLTGATVKRSETFNAPANDVVKAVRLGSHPGKLRVVVDLVKAEAPKYDWKAGKRQVILRMLEKAAPAGAPETAQLTAQPAAQLPQASAEKVAEPAAEQPKLPESAGEAEAISLGDTEQQAREEAPQAALPEKAVEAALPAQEPEKPAQATQEEKISPTAAAQEPTLAPTTAPSAEQPGSLGAAAAAQAPQAASQPPAQSNIKIVGYRFEYGEPGKTPILKVTLNSNGALAQISKVDSTTYKIVVPKSALANEELVLPQFPPADFVGFIMVMSEEVSGSVEITVSVEEGVTLNTMVKGDEIWALASGT